MAALHLSVVAAPGGATTGPALTVPQATLDAALHCPSSYDTTDGLEPVLLVHGTLATDEENWNWSWTPALGLLGFDVCTVTLPDLSLPDIQLQTEYVVHAIRTIAGDSGETVDVAGHSQGTLQPRWAIRWWPEVAVHVDDYVSLAGPHHGTPWVRAGTTPLGCSESCWQMVAESNFLGALNAGDETPGDISYTSVYTLFDELVQPTWPESEATSALDGATNVLIQDLCPGRPVDHVGFTTDAVAFDITVRAFTGAGPFDPATFDAAVCGRSTFDGIDWERYAGLALRERQLPDFHHSTEEPPLRPYAQ